MSPLNVWLSQVKRCSVAASSRRMGGNVAWPHNFFRRAGVTISPPGDLRRSEIRDGRQHPDRQRGEKKCTQGESHGNSAKCRGGRRKTREALGSFPSPRLG